MYEDTKILTLYRLIDSTKLSSILLYSSINAMVITECFISMSMKDRRILSYLIVDPNEKEHKKRIENLPSRITDESLLREDEIKQNKEIYEKFYKVLETLNFEYNSLDLNKSIFDENDEKIKKSTI